MEPGTVRAALAPDDDPVEAAEPAPTGRAGPSNGSPAWVPDPGRDLGPGAGCVRRPAPGPFDRDAEPRVAIAVAPIGGQASCRIRAARFVSRSQSSDLVAPISGHSFDHSRSMIGSSRNTSVMLEQKTHRRPAAAEAAVPPERLSPVSRAEDARRARRRGRGRPRSACRRPPRSNGHSRVEVWRGGLGRGLCSLLARPFVCGCHIISTMLRFHTPLIKPGGRISRTRLSDKACEMAIHTRSPTNRCRFVR